MNKRSIVLAGMILAAALARLVPHPPNVTPIGAMALFGGACFVNRKMAYLLPLAAMLLSDLVLGYTRFGLWSLLAIQPVVYACLLATAAIGHYIADRRSVWQVAGGALAGSLLFFVVTNLATWAGGRLYPLTASGLAACYTAAHPVLPQQPPRRRRVHRDPVRRTGDNGGPADVDARAHRDGAGIARGGRMRVVSLLASGTEIVCALGAGEWLVGRSHECDNPTWVTALPACTRPAFDTTTSSGQIDAEVRRRLRTGEPLYHVDSILIDSLKPDLLVTQAHCEVCAVTPGDVARAGCVAAGQVLALRAGSVQGIFDGAAAIGRALGRERAAADLVDAMRRRMAAVHDAVKYRRTPSVVMLEWTDPVFVMGNWGPELADAANGRPLLGERGGLSSAIGWQRVCDADPEWLIVAPCGFDLERTRREVPTLEELPGWSSLRSVRAGQVVLADGNRYFNRSGTTIVETVEMLAEILHGYPAGRRGKAWEPYRRPRFSALLVERHAHACAKNQPTYTDPATGYSVFTADFLKQRGYCCGNGCRHCPWEPAAGLGG